jgi:hypothetical protein
LFPNASPPRGLPWTEAEGHIRHRWLHRRIQGPSGNPGTQSDHHPCGSEDQRTHGAPARGPPRCGIRGSSRVARLIPFHSGPAVCVKPGQPSNMHRQRFAADGHRLAACGYRQNPCFKSPTIHRDPEPPASWPPATGKGQPPLDFPPCIECLHPEQSGTETEMNRPQLSFPLLRQGQRQPHHLPGQGRGSQGPKPESQDFARSPKAGGTWERTSPHGTAASSERRRSRKR